MRLVPASLWLAPWTVAGGLVLNAAAALIAPAPAAGAFGSPVLARGAVLLGVTTRQFTRDIYDVEAGAISNRKDTFGYVAFESRVGLFKEHLDLGLEIGRAHNAQNRFPDRDYMTWDMGVTVRGLVVKRPDSGGDLTAGIHYRESIAFDRKSTLTHKLQRNLAAFLLIGRTVSAYDRPIRIYGGPLYSRHEIDEYGASYRPNKGPGVGETRSNVEILLGASVRPVKWIEGAAEVEYRDTVSFGLSAGVLY